MVMDPVDCPAATRPSFPSPSDAATLQGQRRTRTQTSPRFAADKDEKLPKVSPLPPRPYSRKTTGPAGKTTTTGWISRTLSRGRSSAASKPLVPLSERRHREDRRGQTATSDAEVAPDGTSAGREGRQFTVAGVGNNGRIYLRPSVRPAHQRYPQPNFTFPITPPSTAVVDSWGQSNKVKHIDTSITADKNEEDAASILSPPWTPTPSAIQLAGDGRQLASDIEASNRPNRCRRARSDSSIHEAGGIRDQDSHVLKITIAAPRDRDEHRPRTMDDVDTIPSAPMLNVPIPSWRLGTPRFTLHGTAMLRGSSYAPTEDGRCSAVSCLNSSLLTPMSSVHGGNSTRRAHPLVVPTPRTPFEAAQRGTPGMASPPSPHPLRSTYVSTHVVIEPAMFTNLTFKPYCDDELIVRYSGAGAVTAATPPRLVAEITSPSFLDYELLSDFFLTFRSFLEPSDLLRMLVARMRWALDRGDEIGMIVRVRTFVALRHWILNYFIDDFIVDYSLRVTFCALVNDFVDELPQEVCSRRAPIKILAELKKCWRRVCAQYWDGDEFSDSHGPEVAITPGGVVGSRDPHLGPDTAPERFSVEPDRQWAVATAASAMHQQVQTSSGKTIPNAVAVGDFVVLDNRPGTPENQMSSPFDADQSPTSPHSLASMDIVSCSFPGKNSKGLGQNTAPSMAAHPVPSNALGHATGAKAATPKVLAGKQVRPTQVRRRRNNSLSDTSRELPSGLAPCTNQESLPASSSGGSLVRGNLLPPDHAFVHVYSAERHGHAQRQTTFVQPKSRHGPNDGMVGGPVSGHGMRKLLRSVRNVLKNKGQGSYSTSQALADTQPTGSSGATVDRLPETAAVPPHQGLIRQNGSRPPVRIDLLGAEVAEDFKKAIREEEEQAAAAAAAAAAATSAGASASASTFSAAAATDLDAQEVGADSGQPRPDSATLLPLLERSSASPVASVVLEASAPQIGKMPFGEMAMTTARKPIVAVGEAVPSEEPSTRETHGVGKASANNTFGDLTMPGGADPTPPNTPPSLNFDGETSRRSSCILNQHVVGPYMIDDLLPHVVPDLTVLEDSQSLRASEEGTQPYMPATRPSGKHPAVAHRHGTYRFHRRARSSQSLESLNNPILHRRDSSVRSVDVPPTLRSVDATSDAEEPGRDEFSQATMPEPLRVLRRRPGGDLKAVANIGDLDRSVLRPSQSVGSLATYAESSIRSSYVLSIPRDPAGEFGAGSESSGRARDDTLSQVQVAERPAKPKLSLFTTPPAKPAMRPSFEAEAKKLAQIPDDDDDGIESALLKLEGKLPLKKPIDLSIVGQSPQSAQDMVDKVEETDKPSAIVGQSSSAGSCERPTLARVGVLSMHTDMDKSAPASEVVGEGQAPVSRPSVRASGSSLSEGGGHDSHCSVTHSQRGLGLGDEAGKPVSPLWAERSILRGADDEESIGDEVSETHNRQVTPTAESHSSFNFIYKTASIEEIGVGRKIPSAALMEDASFLKDDSVDGSEVAPDRSDNDEDNVKEDIDDMSNQRVAEIRVGHVFDYDFATHAVSDALPTTGSPPPCSPHIPSAQASNMSPEGIEAAVKSDASPKKPLPPRTEPTPGMGYGGKPRSTAHMLQRGEPLSGATQPNVAATSSSGKHSVHLPFVLAFDSNVLAQQFTLIEKDALAEIDWRELVDINWKHFASSNTRSWVDFLRNTDAQGVDVIIARFNLMVKWAVSEIVLTQHMEERARCIIKLIHIAAHCRRYHNFATTAQLTIALSSNEVSRLSKTWKLVSEGDRKTLHDLERLVTPSRNFRSMREEMEVGTSGGCIPFVGIYTHDLLYNAQRPSEIATSPTTAPLVNFERCRTAAAVVKTLLRLLEASTRYTFQPIEGVTERCLWIGALSDDEIRKHSRNLG